MEISEIRLSLKEAKDISCLLEEQFPNTANNLFAIVVKNWMRGKSDIVLCDKAALPHRLAIENDMLTEALKRNGRTVDGLTINALGDVIDTLDFDPYIEMALDFAVQELLDDYLSDLKKAIEDDELETI